MYLTRCLFRTRCHLFTIGSRGLCDVEQVANQSDASSDTKPLQFTGFIPPGDLRISTMRASGPGGQNVNKSETKVRVGIHLETASKTWLPPHIATHLSLHCKSMITSDGYLTAVSDKTRKQMLNQADALAKIRCEIWKAVEACTPEAEPTPEELALHEKRQKRAELLRRKSKEFQSLKKQRRLSPEDFR